MLATSESGDGPEEMRNPRLELTWIGKEKRPKLEPRILLKDREKCYHAAHRVTDLFGAQPCSKADRGLD